MEPIVSPIRVRFAPAPTGMMHLGNVRQALINFLFARHNRGAFIIRIEDTDTQRLFDRDGAQILADLAWLSLSYDEGPHKAGPHGPYFQSQRTHIYQQHLARLQNKQAVYRCFCTTEELERKRQRQIDLKKPPRYDRTCAQLTPEESAAKVAHGVPFIWRFRLTPEVVTISDLVRGSITFDLAHFSDFPLTRQDGSFTFIFANCVDDITMKITHVFRGEDHLSNTANQVMLYRAFDAPVPLFWHTPIVCNKEGKKLSKRDFGFSLDDLRIAGYVPESILNYLATIGGAAGGTEEIKSLEELIRIVDFSHHGTANTIRYDSDKLRWMNHEWLKKLPTAVVAEQCRPFLEQAYGIQAKALSVEKRIHLVRCIQAELFTLADVVPLLHGFFHTPQLDPVLLHNLGIAQYRLLFEKLSTVLTPDMSPAVCYLHLKQVIDASELSGRSYWTIIRAVLTGSTEGTSIKQLLEMIPISEVVARLRQLTA